MSYTVIARKWRPQKFSDLIGQEHVAKTLLNAISSDRIAHGYICTGPRGVGKTSSARLFAKAVNCENLTDGEPCNVCPSCKDITDGSSLDVIEIDGASNNSVDNIRDLRDNVRFLPTNGKYKIYIIDEVHMLSKGAFNALLKTLEEPPKHVIFIFATTEIHKVLPTILSRCQRFDFKRIPTAKIVERLKFICEQEHISISDDALLLIAKKADGGMRDSQSLLDQIISFCGKNITQEDVNASLGIIQQDLFFDIIDAFIEKNTAKGIQIINNVFQDGYDLTEMIHGLEEHLRQLIICVTMDSYELLDTVEDYKQRFLDQSKHFSQKDILRIVEVIQQTERSVKSGQYPKLKLELAVSKICQMDRSVELNDILELLKGQKKNFSSNVIDTHVEKKIERPIVVQNKPEPINPKSVPINREEPRSLSSIDDVKKIEPTSSEKNHTQIVETTLNKGEVSLESVKKVWTSLTSQFKGMKPALYACMFQSAVKEISGNVATIIFNNDATGKNSSVMLDRNKAFVESKLSETLKTRISIQTKFEDFKALGIEIDYQDIESVVKRVREKDKNMDSLMNMFGLEPDSFVN